MEGILFHTDEGHLTFTRNESGVIDITFLNKNDGNVTQDWCSEDDLIILIDDLGKLYRNED